MELIYRDEAIKAINDVLTEDVRHRVWLKSRINNLKPVDAQPVRHGIWIYLDKDNKFFKKHLIKCSLCNNSLDLYAVNGGRGDANFCPNCGARMEKPE